MAMLKLLDQILVDLKLLDLITVKLKIVSSNHIKTKIIRSNYSKSKNYWIYMPYQSNFSIVYVSNNSFLSIAGMFILENM